MSIINLNLRQTWAYNGSNGNVTLPSNASFTQALAEYYGITAPVNGSWDYAIAQYLGVAIGPNQSIIQKLAEHYGATEPVNGSWLFALAINATDGPIADLIWNLTETQWQAETTLWNAGAAPTPVTVVEVAQDSFVHTYRPDSNQFFWTTQTIITDVDTAWTQRAYAEGGDYYTAQNTNALTWTLTGSIQRPQPDDPSKIFGGVIELIDTGNGASYVPDVITGWPTDTVRNTIYPYTLVWENIIPSGSGIMGLTIPDIEGVNQYFARSLATFNTTLTIERLD